MEKESVRSAERREERPVGSTGTRMQVRKRNGSLEPVDLNKIVLSIQRPSEGLPRVDAMRVATRTMSGLYDGATTRELDQLSIQTAASLVTEEPEYGKLAARLLSTYVDKEVRNQDIMSFSQSIARGKDVGLIGERVRELRRGQRPQAQRRRRPRAHAPLRVLRPPHALRPLPPQAPRAPRRPRDAAVLLPAHRVRPLRERRRGDRPLPPLLSLEYLPSSPTLFNSGTRHEQLSSCFLLDSPEDDLGAIYKRYADVAMLSKFSGGIGLAYHRVRSRGSLIRARTARATASCRGSSTLDSSVAAVNQGGKRKGAACVYLETWHADIEEFLELRDNTGDEARRTHNLNLANWVPDLFMKRVEADEDWSLFDPKRAPHLTDLWGADFERAYEGRGRGLGQPHGEGARALRPHDADARPDR
jgi:ribonucleoside-diphosphate reductase alpha chain